MEVRCSGVNNHLAEDTTFFVNMFYDKSCLILGEKQTTYLSRAAN